MARHQILLEYPGTYGGSTSREEVLRILKEALALVENTPAGTQITCSGLRIELLDAGVAGPSSSGPAVDSNESEP